MTIEKMPVGQLRLGKYIADLVDENVKLRRKSMHPDGCTCKADELRIVNEEWDKVSDAASLLLQKYSSQV